MNMKDFEWTVERLASTKVFGKEESEALVHCRDIVAALRAALDLPQNFNAKDIVAEIWAKADQNV